MTKKDNRLHWFSNTELRDYVNRIKTKHTLVTTEACFSGSIFTSGFKDITEFACNEIAKVPSFRAMTSGANTVVPVKCIFIKYIFTNWLLFYHIYIIIYHFYYKFMVL